jgi:ubiquinone/menaquinone biosynthesis C-methylase UbiE
MDVVYEKKYHQLEERHWWFKSRRDILIKLITDLAIKKESSILEIGCSGGALMAELVKMGYTNLTGIDISQSAIDLSRERGMVNVSVMDGANLEFKENSFDLLLASDVLEHIENEEAALREWRRVLKPGGIIVIFVPAFNHLWSQHDVVNHHFRRYSMKRLTHVVEHSHFIIKRRSYWNFFLFSPTLLVRTIQNKFYRANSKSDNLQQTNKLVNFALTYLVKFENFLLRFASYPVGVSLFIIAEKPVK